VSAVPSEVGGWVVPVVGGIEEIADRYDGFILDVWGVLHNGVEPYPRVVDTLSRLKRAGKRLCVLSNAPVQAETVAGRIETIGIPRDAYHHIMTSGEEVWQHLKHRPDAFYKSLGRKVLHIGPERDKGMLDGLDLVPVAAAADADFVLNTGPGEPADTVATYQPLLDAAAARKLPMVCANPDLTVMRGPEVLICAGSLAQAYEAQGGTVRWHGKPFPGVYRTCMALLGLSDRSRHRQPAGRRRAACRRVPLRARQPARCGPSDADADRRSAPESRGRPPQLVRRRDPRAQWSARCRIWSARPVS
jgi:HAD superfamily hydrolase (TIGR01459 family)